jgi:hypothetical protein
MLAKWEEVCHLIILTVLYVCVWKDRGENFLYACLVYLFQSSKALLKPLMQYEASSKFFFYKASDNFFCARHNHFFTKLPTTSFVHVLCGSSVCVA